MPFAFGDVDPQGRFVHVFDETALDLVTFEMDTITDFARYLGERERAIRDETLRYSPSEAELLAMYMTTEGADGKHAFPRPEALGATFTRNSNRSRATMLYLPRDSHGLEHGISYRAVHRMPGQIAA
jgi:hypothetical protein